MGKEDLASKPEGVRAKIVEGRLDKIKRNYALLEQPALRDNNKTVGEVIKETIAATGENIQVRGGGAWGAGVGERGVEEQGGGCIVMRGAEGEHAVASPDTYCAA
jgi:translation elongation factor EF-Ts